MDLAEVASVVAAEAYQLTFHQAHRSCLQVLPAVEQIVVAVVSPVVVVEEVSVALAFEVAWAVVAAVEVSAVLFEEQVSVLVEALVWVEV